MGRSQEEENHTHTRVKARFVVPSKKWRKLKTGRKRWGAIQKAISSLTFYLFLPRVRGCGEGVWAPSLTQQLQLLLRERVLEEGKRGAEQGGQPVLLSQKRPRESEERTWDGVKPKRLRYFQTLQKRKLLSKDTEFIPAQTRRPRGDLPPPLPLVCTVPLGHFKSGWGQWRCKGNEEKGINYANKVYKINWKQDFSGIFPLIL